MHPYAPVREVSAETSFEVAPSAATQALVALGPDITMISMEATLIAKSYSSPALSSATQRVAGIVPRRLQLVVALIRE